MGAATARALQRAGYGVTLLESDEPGRSTSYGNAGFIAIDHVLPLARRSTLKKIPKMLLDRTGPLTVHLPSIPAILPWMARFALAAGSGTEVRKGIEVFSTLMAEASTSWKLEIRASRLERLIRSNGALYIYETEQAFTSAAAERELQKARGAAWEVIDANRAREMVPGLGDHILRGVYYPRGMHTTNPYRLVTALVESFVADGGKVQRGRAVGFGREGKRITSVKLADAEFVADLVIITAGLASRDLAHQLGFRAPLASERGYHVMLAPDNVHFDLPVGSAERGFFITPMEEGLRVAGTSELSASHQNPSWQRADLLVSHARKVFPGLVGAERSRWMGERPSLPDFRPAIGRAPGLVNVYCGYGHQHYGLTLATATGKLIARLMNGDTLPVSLNSCDPGRFD